MNFNFVSMNEQYAKELVENWKYEGIYECYNYVNEKDHIMDSSLWGIDIFAVLDDSGELIGETTLEFYDENAKYIQRIKKNEEVLSKAELWVGFQLRPDLTGKGIGPKFVQSCVNFAIKKTNYTGNMVRLAVYNFNERAKKAYQKAGFKEIEKITNDAGQVISFMGKRIKNR